jgi:hypothetical protein
VLCRESERCANDLIDKTVSEDDVNPLPHIQLYAINVMLSVVYGTDALKTPEDPLFKKMLHIVETTLRLLNPTEDISAFLPVLSFMDVLLKKESKMKDFWENESLPVTVQLIQESRKSDHDSLAKKIDSLKDDLELDEQNLRAILSKYFTIFYITSEYLPLFFFNS